MFVCSPNKHPNCHICNISIDSISVVTFFFISSCNLVLRVLKPRHLKLQHFFVVMLPDLENICFYRVNCIHARWNFPVVSIQPPRLATSSLRTSFPTKVYCFFVRVKSFIVAKQDSLASQKPEIYKQRKVH